MCNNLYYRSVYRNVNINSKNDLYLFKSELQHVAVNKMYKKNVKLCEIVV